MTDRPDWGRPPHYPQHEGNGQQAWQGQPQQPRQYDPAAHHRRLQGAPHEPPVQPAASQWQGYGHQYPPPGEPRQPQPGTRRQPYPGQPLQAQPEWRSPAHGQQLPYSPLYVPQPPASRHPAARPRPIPAARKLPPYPAHLVRFPWNTLPRSRRRRGPSIGRIFYLGRHPFALLIEAFLTILALEVIVAWAVLVVGVWAVWASAVSMGWLVQVAAAALKR